MFFSLRRVFIFWVLSLSFPAYFLFSQTLTFSDNFDSYNPGQQLACQNPTDWTTWSESPCNPIEDALISSVQSFSPPNSVVIIQNNDIVKNFGMLTNGVCEINFRIYIPSGKSGYFNTLADFTPPYIWAMQVFFDAPGTGRVDAAGASAATFIYPHDSWLPIKVVADLISDRGEFWLNGVMIHSWQWTQGIFANTSIPLQVNATDFYGSALTDQMFVDDYSVSFDSKIVSTAAGGNWNSASTWVGGIVPLPSDPVEIVSTASVTLDANIIRNTVTLINGRLNCGAYLVSGNGNIFFPASSFLEIGSADGISSSSPSGNIQVTGVRSFSTGANYTYNGSSAQVTGDGLPATVNSLTINNTLGLSLTNSVVAAVSLTMTSGNIILNGNTLTLGTGKGSTTRGTLSWGSGFITGNGTFKRWFSNANITIGNVQGLFPMGTTSKNRNVWVGGKPSAGGTISIQHIDADGVSSISFTENSKTFISRSNHNWTISTAGGFSGNNLSLRLQASGFQNNQISDLNISLSSGAAGGNYSSPTGTIMDPQVNRISLTAASLSNFFYFASVYEPLPVELTSFSAAYINNAVHLNWETATEVNNYGFEVERKLNVKGQIANDWVKIGFVNGSGNSNSPKHYSFIDETFSETGKCAYRLKQIDSDGAFEYSKIIEVDVTAPIEFSLSQNYPNPFNPVTSINFNIPEEGKVTITIYNSIGELLETIIDEVKQAGAYAVNFDAGGLSSGVYIYKIDWMGKSFMNKMTLLK